MRLEDARFFSLKIHETRKQRIPLGNIRAMIVFDQKSEIFPFAIIQLEKVGDFLNQRLRKFSSAVNDPVHEPRGFQVQEAHQK